MTLITDNSEDTAQPTNPADETSTTDPAGDGLARLAWLLAQAYVHGPNWLGSLWGIRPGSSSPVCQLSSDHVPGEAVYWLRHFWAVEGSPLKGAAYTVAGRREGIDGRAAPRRSSHDSVQ